MSPASLDQQIRVTRSFNRFYTRRIGVLEEGLLHSPFSLAEARILFEIATREAPDAAALARELGLDRGYLSRLLHGLRRRHLVVTRAVPGDRRRRRLELTDTGRAAFLELDGRSRDEVGSLLGRLAPDDRARLVEAMGTIRRLLDGPSDSPKVTLRSLQPGDLGWVVHRHGLLYAREYGWDARFEALVAEVVAEFVRHFDPMRDRAWIAERESGIVGSVFLVRQSDEVAKLRLLLVEPEARGAGLGRRLVTECVEFARAAGYRRLSLWTNDVLQAARHLYEAAGFRLVKQEPHRSFGEALVGETWELEL